MNGYIVAQILMFPLIMLVMNYVVDHLMITGQYCKQYRFNKWVIVQFDDGYYGLRRNSLRGAEYIDSTIDLGYHWRAGDRYFICCKTRNIATLIEFQEKYNGDKKRRTARFSDLFIKESRSINEAEMAAAMLGA